MLQPHSLYDLCRWICKTTKSQFDLSVLPKEHQANVRQIKTCCIEINPAVAAAYGHLTCLKRALDDPRFKHDYAVIYYAARNGQVHIIDHILSRNKNLNFPDLVKEVVLCQQISTLRFLIEKKFELTADVMVCAVLTGDIGLVKYLRQNNCPWDERTVQTAIKHRNREIAIYALRHGCPYKF